jgi:hypothetical protein
VSCMHTLLDWHPKLLKLLKTTHACKTCTQSNCTRLQTAWIHSSKLNIKQNLGPIQTSSDGCPLVWSKNLENATKLRLQIHVFGNHLSNMKKLILFTIQSEFDSDNK